MTRAQKLWARVKVVWRAAPTWLAGAAFVVQVVADEVTRVLPDAAEPIGAVALQIVAWLGCAVAIIRRVTPVPPEQRGLLSLDQEVN